MEACIMAEGGTPSQGSLQARLAAETEHQGAAIAGHKELQC